MNLFLPFVVIFAVFELINSETIYDVTKYGADNKGEKKSTDAIKKAIEAAHAKGGGTVSFPAGKYLSGPIKLLSNIHLNIEDKATIEFSKDMADYPATGGKVTPLISAKNETNIGITGKGVVDGQGSNWWHLASSELHKRPVFIAFDDCKKILFEDVHIKNSPMMNINIHNSDGIEIKGINIENPVPSPNTDGINLNSVKNVVISKVTISTGDDCIAINANNKSPTENVHISDSHMLKGHAGVGIGSITTGGIRNITATNLVFTGTETGLKVKTNRERGGVVENLHYSDITMNDMIYEGIVLSMVYDAAHQEDALHNTTHIEKKAVTATTPHFKNIEYSNIKGSAKYSIVFVGVPESPISDIKMTNVEISTKNPVSFVNTKNVVLNGKKES